MDRNRTKKALVRSWMFIILVFLLAHNVHLSGRVDERKEQAADLKVIRQALAKSFSPEKQANQMKPLRPRWVKIWIKNKKGTDEEIKITLPVSFIDFLIANAELGQKGEKGSDDREGDFVFRRQASWRKAAQVQFLDIWRELKTLGPGSVVELKGEEGFLRIWLE